MKLFDVNILIYAHRMDQEHHEFFRDRLEATLRGSAAYGVSVAVASGFVRIVTHPNFPNGPTPLPQALSVIEAMASSSAFHWVHPGSRHWNLVAELCRKEGAVGKAVSDAAHAALAIEHGGTWVSRDSDFRRYARHGLRWEEWSP